MTLRMFCLVVLSVLLAAFLLADCNCRQPVLITQLFVDHVSDNNTFDMEREEIRQSCKKILSNEKNVKAKWNGSRKGVLRVRFRFLPVQGKDGAGRLMVNLKYSEITNQGLQQYFGSASVAVANLREHHVVFERAFLESLEELISSWQGEKQSTSQLLESMSEAWADDTVHENQLLQNIHLLGIKKEKKAVPVLIKILLGGNERAAIVSLAALTNIADPAALDAVTQYAERKNAEVRKQAILAVRQMGGLKSAAWLFTLSTGHDDPEVRVAASEALKYVEEKLKKN